MLVARSCHAWWQSLADDEASWAQQNIPSELGKSALHACRMPKRKLGITNLFSTGAFFQAALRPSTAAVMVSAALPGLRLEPCLKPAVLKKMQTVMGDQHAVVVQLLYGSFTEALPHFRKVAGFV